MSRRYWFGGVVVVAMVVLAGCGQTDSAGRSPDPDTPVDDSQSIDPAAPEHTGTIVVTVVDSAGGPVADAMVVPGIVDSTEPGFAFSEEGRFTDASGVYEFAAVPPGEYTVSILVDGTEVAGPETLTVAADTTEALTLTVTT